MGGASRGLGGRADPACLRASAHVAIRVSRSGAGADGDGRLGTWQPGDHERRRERVFLCQVVLYISASRAVSDRRERASRPGGPDTAVRFREERSPPGEVHARWSTDMGHQHVHVVRSPFEPARRMGAAHGCRRAVFTCETHHRATGGSFPVNSSGLNCLYIIYTQGYTYPRRDDPAGRLTLSPHQRTQTRRKNFRRPRS